MNWNRILSALVVLIYMIVMGISEGGGGKELFRIGVYLLFPLGFIWFGNELGRLTGISYGRIGGPYITKESPGCLVVFLGWVMLLMPAILGLFNVSIW